MTAMVCSLVCPLPLWLLSNHSSLRHTSLSGNHSPSYSLLTFPNKSNIIDPQCKTLQRLLTVLTMAYPLHYLAGHSASERPYGFWSIGSLPRCLCCLECSPIAPSTPASGLINAHSSFNRNPSCSLHWINTALLNVVLTSHIILSQISLSLTRRQVSNKDRVCIFKTCWLHHWTLVPGT